MSTLSNTISRVLLFAGLGAGLAFTAGCGHPQYAYAPPPPPPAEWNGPRALIDLAEANGHRDGFDDGRRDAAQGRRYAPQHDGKFRGTPGYDPSVGPFGAYQQYYRNAYTRAYYRGFSGR